MSDGITRPAEKQENKSKMIAPTKSTTERHHFRDLLSSRLLGIKSNLTDDSRDYIVLGQYIQASKRRLPTSLEGRNPPGREERLMEK
jgi:hypothetical protein